MAYPKLTDEPGAVALAAQLRGGELSPIEAVEAALARIEDVDAPINAIAVADFDRARETAQGMTAPGPEQPLWGVPMTVKESFDVAGLPTSWGHERYKGSIAARDARVIARL